MIRVPASTPRRAGSLRAAQRAFTLIELLAVITIILILAGLILNIAGNAQYKAAMARANSEIKQMETALESYKADTGNYPEGPASTTTPPAPTSTDTLNAQSQTEIDPSSSGGTANPDYSAACTFLFQQLSGNTQLAASNPTTGSSKIYITFAPGQLSTGSALPTSATYIIDPFGFCYGYSTANAYAVANGTPTTTAGYNPTFDLWSTGGYSPSSGKAYPTNVTPAQYNTLWAKNW